MRIGTAALMAGVVGAAAGAASGQCQPAWDATIGNPGVSGGYVAPIFAWNDGSGERIYVGGSFTEAGGSAANQYLAAWNPTNNTWSSLGTGISAGFTNAFMTAMVPYDPGTGERLVVAGFFDTAGGVPETASLAMWNGSSWEAMGTGWTGITRGSIWSLAVWQGRLYVGGGVVNQPAQIAGQTWAGMASWDGEEWVSHISTITGISPNIFSFKVFNDGSGEALYAIGRFTSIDGIPGTSLVARWNGTAWSAVGNGLTPATTTAGLEASAIFDDGSGPALYVGGGQVNGAVGGTTNVAKWDGQQWTAVGGVTGGRITSMVVFDDGTGPALYIGGTAIPAQGYFAKLVNGQWETVGGGITAGTSGNPSVFGMNVIGDDLYVGGSFSQVGGSVTANGIAVWTGCPSTCYANCDGSTAAPILNVNDFICFQSAFAAGDPYANCDGSTQVPVLNVNDFICFQSAFAAGCP